MNALQRHVVVSIAIFACTATLSAQTNVLTWRNNIGRDGLNATETVLNQTNVNSAQFGKICSAVFDGQIYAQPLVVSRGGQNTVYVATQNDSIYAVNATNCSVINSVSLLEPTEEPVQCTDVGGAKCKTVSPAFGILGTPVIDPTTNTLYVVSESELTTGQCVAGTKRKPNTCFIHRLHALNFTTFAEKYDGPVAIAGSYQNISFTSYNHIQRPGLLELSGAMPNGDSGIYIGFSEADGGGTPGVSIPHGWILGYDAKNLKAAPYVWSSTPNGEGGGVWASGAGLAAGLDSPSGSNYIYFTTGDGDFTANTGGSDYGDSFVKLTPSLVPASYFTPFAQACMNPADMDFGSSGVMLLPNSGSTYYGIAASKLGDIFVMNRADPGGYTPPTNSTCPATGTNANAQYFLGSSHQYYTTPGYWDSQMYAIPMFGTMTKYQINSPACPSVLVCTTNTVHTAVSFEYGTNLSLSASGTAEGTGIVWAALGNGWPTALTPAPVTLYAFDAEHVVSKAIPTLWNSSQCPTRDQTGNSTKFVVPTIANGMVFLGSMDPTDTTNTRGRLDVFGLTSAPCN
ncbi:MAG: hypothetical protein ABR880_05090 [Candidatus Sulfotelmatobacter sp.]|jgi:hypothetical protein